MAGRIGSRAETARRWRDRLARWRKSGHSISEFCRRENLSPPSFFQWKKRLASESGVGAKSQHVGTPAFIPVEVVSKPASSSRVEIQLGDVLLRVPSNMDEQSLRAVREEAARC